MSKRAKFIIAALILALALWGTRLIVPSQRMQAVVAIVVASYLISAWVLFEDLKGVEWLTVLILPVMYTLGAGLFSLFLPESIPRIFGQRLEADVSRLIAGIIRGGFWLLFGVGAYGLYLTENIFSVAAIRTIQLLRAARAVGFLITLVVAMFLFQALFSFKLQFYWLGILAGLLSFPLFLQGNWSMQLKSGLNRRVIQYSVVGAVIVAQLAMVLSFWPVASLVAALMLVTVMYVTLGLSQQKLIGRLFKKQINEYVAVALAVLVASFYITSWR